MTTLRNFVIGKWQFWNWQESWSKHTIIQESHLCETRWDFIWKNIRALLFVGHFSYFTLKCNTINDDRRIYVCRYDIINNLHLFQKWFESFFSSWIFSCMYVMIIIKIINLLLRIIIFDLSIETRLMLADH